jgi:cell division protein FtsQ
VRAGAALAMLLSAAAVYGVGASTAFDYTKLQLDGVRFTDPTDVEAALVSARGENLFQLSTGPLRTALERLSTVASARVEVRLPGTLAVTIDERQPVLVWQVGKARYLVEASGTLFAKAPDTPPAGTPALPVVDDRRASSSGLAVGQRLDAVDLDAATRLGSLVPDDLGSSAVSLVVAVTDDNGFVVSARPDGWSAVFGFYTPSLRTTELVPGQVQLLRSLLIGREQLVERVILASETDGTYVPRATPSATPKPSKAP